jgi:hypothetical protein
MKEGKDKLFVGCVLCGMTKIYKTRNKRRCPFRYTHKWIPIILDDKFDEQNNLDGYYRDRYEKGKE